MVNKDAFYLALINLKKLMNELKIKKLPIKLGKETIIILRENEKKQV